MLKKDLGWEGWGRRISLVATVFSKDLYGRRIKTRVGLERVNPVPGNKILDWSKLKQIADDISKCILKWKISTI